MRIVQMEVGKKIDGSPPSSPNQGAPNIEAHMGSIRATINA